MQVSVGEGFVCALAWNGEVWCVGENDRGLLGNGTRVDSDVAVRVLLPTE